MKKANTYNRNSSVELLRIVMIILIIFHHYCYHGLEESDTFSLSILPIYQRIIIQILHNGGIIANNVFAIISGYFLINSEKSDYSLKIRTILLEYCTYIIAISAIVAFGFKYGINTFVKGVISPWIGGNWYISVYCILLLFVPVINRALIKIPHKEYKYLIRLLLVLGYVLPCFKFYSGFNTNCSIEGMFIMYMIGAYINLYGFDFVPNNINHIDKKTLFLAIILAQIFMYIVCDIVADLINIPKMNNTVMNSTFLFWGGYCRH